MLRRGGCLLGFPLRRASSFADAVSGSPCPAAKRRLGIRKSGIAREALKQRQLWPFAKSTSKCSGSMQKLQASLDADLTHSLSDVTATRPYLQSLSYPITSATSCKNLQPCQARLMALISPPGAIIRTVNGTYHACHDLGQHGRSAVKTRVAHRHAGTGHTTRRERECERPMGCETRPEMESTFSPKKQYTRKLRQKPWTYVLKPHPTRTLQRPFP